MNSIHGYLRNLRNRRMTKSFREPNLQLSLDDPQITQIAQKPEGESLLIWTVHTVTAVGAIGRARLSEQMYQVYID